MKASLKRKEVKFLTSYLEGKSLAICAKDAGSKGSNNKSLTVIGCQKLASLSLSMPETMELMGLTDQLLAQKTMEGLDAKKVEIATYKGSICDERSYPDYSTRAKYVELSGRFKGKFIDKMELTGKDGGEITLLVSPVTGGRSNKKHSLEIE